MALAKLGEVMPDVDWRTQRRLAGVPSRPPPSRPDRGYVEQPEERIAPTVVRKRGLIPMSDLEREQLADLEEELKALEAPSIVAIADSSTVTDRERGITSRHSAEPFPRPLLQPQPETQPSRPPAPEPAEMAAKKKRTRIVAPPHVKAAAVARVLELEAADTRGFKRTGIPSRVGKEMGQRPENVMRWATEHKAIHGNAPPSAVSSTKTLVSSPASSPMSGPVSITGPLPPMPTVTLTGLEEYVRALVAQEVKAAFAKLGGG